MIFLSVLILITGICFLKTIRKHLLISHGIFLNSCHFFKVSDEEAMLITGAVTLNDAVEILLAKNQSCFCYYTGQRRNHAWHEQQETVIIPSIQVKPVDTTGAGDAFVGAVCTS